MLVITVPPRRTHRAAVVRPPANDRHCARKAQRASGEHAGRRQPDSLEKKLTRDISGRRTQRAADLGPAIAGSIGIAPGGNINPEKEYPSMFEPVHGSAPDIAGKGIANPIAQIWTGAMMLDHLLHQDGGRAVVQAIARVVEEGKMLTGDLGGIDGRRWEGYCRLDLM